VIVVKGCTVKRSEGGVESPFALELMDPTKKVYRAFDYIHLIFEVSWWPLYIDKNSY